jgi:Matrixin
MFIEDRKMKNTLLAGGTTGLFVSGFVGIANAYSTYGEGWDGPGSGHIDLTWTIASTTSDMSYSEQYNITELALADWATYADITFTFANSVGNDNQLDFYLGADSSATNGFWGYGYYPNDINSDPLAGDVFIDDGTTAPFWTTGTEGIAEYIYNYANSTWISADLYYELHHEIGHALGLLHPVGDTDNLAEGAVMSPYFGWDADGDVGFLAFDTLQSDDIAGIQSLYAAPVPVPGAAWLFGSGLLGLAGMARRKKVV